MLCLFLGRVSLLGFFLQWEKGGRRVKGVEEVESHTCDVDGRTIVACFHDTTEENRDVGYFYLFEGGRSLEDVKGHVGKWTDYVHEESNFWFGSHCNNELYCLECLTRRCMERDRMVILNAHV
jgi:hypothetical protein